MENRIKSHRFDLSKSREEKLQELKSFLNDIEVDPAEDYRYTVEFKEPTEILTPRHTHKSVLNTGRIKFFTTNKNKLLYSKTKKQGESVLKIIDNLEVIKIERSTDRTQLAEKVINILPDGVWSELKEKLKKDPENALPESNLKPIYYACKFPEDGRNILREKLADVFAEFRDFSYEYKSTSGRGNGRDLKIMLQLGPDGVYRGWLSSEYPGTNTGDYFIILNEKLAIYNGTDNEN